MARHKSLIPKDFDGNYTEDMLTERQKQVLNFIRSYAQTKGYPPSVREICKAVGLSSTASVHNHLHKLQNMRFIQRDSAKPRALELTQEASWRNKTVVPVPLVGNVTAGVPILAVENIEETYPIPLDLIGTEEDVFMLSVKGDSMINAGILPLTFVNEADYDRIGQGDDVVLENLRADIESGKSELTLINRSNGEEIPVFCELTGRTRNIILAGGLLDYTRLSLTSDAGKN